MYTQQEVQQLITKFQEINVFRKRERRLPHPQPAKQTLAGDTHEHILFARLQILRDNKQAKKILDPLDIFDLLIK